MTENTRTNHAQEYADSIARTWWDREEDGAPFGMPEECDCGVQDAHDDNEDGDHHHTPAVCTACDTCRCEPLTAWDYLDDVLEVDYIVSSRGEYRGAEVLITWGGPNTYIDTRAQELRVHWGGEAEVRYLPPGAIDAIDEALAELWDTRA